MLAEIADGGLALQEPARGLGEDDLPSVRGRGDARGPMNVDPDVTLVGHEWLTRVDAHAYANRAAVERVPRLVCGGNGVSGAGERDEEGIALGVHFDALVSRERLPQDSSMLVEQIGVAPPVLLQESCRALDVREEEGDGAGRQLGPAHRAILSPAVWYSRPPGLVSAVPTPQRPSNGRPEWPREESNLRAQIRSLPLYPLSYGAPRGVCPPLERPLGRASQAARSLSSFSRTCASITRTTVGSN